MRLLAHNHDFKISAIIQGDMNVKLNNFLCNSSYTLYIHTFYITHKHFCKLLGNCISFKVYDILPYLLSMLLLVEGGVKNT